MTEIPRNHRYAAEVLVKNHKPANIKVTARRHEKQNEANIKIDNTSKIHRILAEYLQLVN